MQRPTANTEPPLSEVQARFAAWRKIKPRGCRIPEELWSAAVELTKIHSLDITNSPIGTYMSRKYYKHLPRYLGDSCFRFNRRSNCPFTENSSAMQQKQLLFRYID